MTSASNHFPYRFTSLFLFFLVLLIVALHYALPLRDSDLWFHLQYAKYFLEHKTLIPDHSIYSWTAAKNEVIYCAWLAELFLYCLYSLGGVPLLFVFRYTCILFMVFAALAHAKHLQLLDHPLTWLLCILGVLMADAAIIVKPEIITFVLFTVLTWNWWHIKSIPHPPVARYYLFPIIMFLWVNSHGAVVFGYIFLGCIMTGEVLNVILHCAALPKKTNQHFYIAMVLSYLMIVVTPYGYHYPFQLFKQIAPTATNTDYISHITAHFSPMVPDAEKLDFFDLWVLSLSLLCISLLANSAKTKRDYSLLTTNLVFASLYTFFYRTTFYWAPVYLFSMLSLLSNRPRVWFPHKLRTRLFQYWTLILACIFLAIYSIQTSLCHPEPYMHIGFRMTDSMPVHETEFIKSNYPFFNIGNSYNQGSYLLWELWPKNKVMIDSRHFPYKEWSRYFFDFTEAPDAYFEFMQKYKCEIWLVGFHQPQLCLWFYNNPEWQLAYYANNAAVFVRKGIGVTATSSRHTNSDVVSLQNPYAALAVFRFAITIQDWKVADLVRSKIESFPQCGKIKTIAVSADLFQKAYQAYFAGNYRECVALLEKEEVSEYLQNQAMLSHSYTHLSNAAWLRNENSNALEYSEKAVTALPTIHARYNFGVIHGYLFQNGTEPIKSKTSIDWKKKLYESMQLTSPLTPIGATMRETAIAILNGERSTERPVLIIPPREEILSCGSISISKL